MTMIKPMVLQGQIWRDCHGDYVHVDYILFDNNKIKEYVNITRIHDGKFLRVEVDKFTKNFNLHKPESNSMVGRVLTDVYNDFFIIESYLGVEECYLLRNLKSSLVELFAMNEIDKHFEIYEYDMEG